MFRKLTIFGCLLSFVSISNVEALPKKVSLCLSYLTAFGKLQPLGAENETSSTIGAFRRLRVFELGFSRVDRGKMGDSLVSGNTASKREKRALAQRIGLLEKHYSGAEKIDLVSGVQIEGGKEIEENLRAILKYSETLDNIIAELAKLKANASGSSRLDSLTVYPFLPKSTFQQLRLAKTIERVISSPKDESWMYASYEFFVPRSMVNTTIQAGDAEPALIKSFDDLRGLSIMPNSIDTERKTGEPTWVGVDILLTSEKKEQSEELDWKLSLVIRSNSTRPELPKPVKDKEEVSLTNPFLRPVPIPVEKWPGRY